MSEWNHQTNSRWPAFSPLPPSLAKRREGEEGGEGRRREREREEGGEGREREEGREGRGRGRGRGRERTEGRFDALAAIQGGPIGDDPPHEGLCQQACLERVY